jgi:hypothetical protein
MVKLETYPKSMYGESKYEAASTSGHFRWIILIVYVEIWWVVRSPTHYTVQKRKGFNVTSPKCTFDTTNNRYASYQHSIIVQ